MWQVRIAMTDRPEAWEEIMDALRPHVPRLWQRLSVADRRTFPARGPRPRGDVHGGTITNG
jgi:uncharacterized NAD(P)/FAD-binding protein YdhS